MTPEIKTAMTENVSGKLPPFWRWLGMENACHQLEQGSY